ncbi:MAG: hypothetical protein HY537_04425 [Deltaproteobacteria bacterium]|nr:hypothetical protein [Deltaproteobacteria bacterium]
MYSDTQQTFRPLSGKAAPIFLCVFIGVLIALLPHLGTYYKHGTWVYLGNTDEGAYLNHARLPYFEAGLKFRSPQTLPSENVPNLYSWVQFVPLSKIARFLNIPILFLTFFWRVIGAILLSLSLYLVFRGIFDGCTRPILYTVFCTCICLADGGFIEGRSLVRNLTFVSHLFHGTTPVGMPHELSQYRVVTPLLNLPVLLFLASILITTKITELARSIKGAIALGLCICLYFYVWTAAVLGLCLIAIASLAIASPYCTKKKSHTMGIAPFSSIALILVFGLLLGAYQIYGNFQISSNPSFKPILDRLCLGRPLLPHDPYRTTYLINYWVFLKLAVGAVGIFTFGFYRLIPIWCFCLAGYLLRNSAVVTLLEFENEHWIFVQNPMGQVLLLGTIVLYLDHKFPTQKAWRIVGAAWTALLLILAIIWRPYEATHASGALQMSKWLSELIPMKNSLENLHRDCSLAGPEISMVAILLSPVAPLHISRTPFSELISDDEVHNRYTLNGWLSQFGLHEFLAQTEMTFERHPGLTTRPEWQYDAIQKIREEKFKKIALDNGSSFMKRYGVCYLLLPQNVTPTRGGSWQQIAQSSNWALWNLIDPFKK